VDPDGGTTFGVLPVWLQTDENHDIRRILAPDVLYNQYFGVGGHARIYSYPSEDQQWSLVAGIMERVQREVDAEFQNGREREQLWSTNGSLIFNRDGTPRFFGFGNESVMANQTDYTVQQELGQAQIGLNLSRTWQLQYTAGFRVVDVLPGTLSKIATLETRFGHILGVGTNHEQLSRVSVIYDTRDSLTIPRRGMQWIAFGGLASRGGLLNDSLYSEAGIDGRMYWAVEPRTTIATHLGLRYEPTAQRLPFWAFSSLGGDGTDIGGVQPLRGFGQGRFYDRNVFAGSVELRQRVLSLSEFSTHIELELTPFVDVGRVFSQTSTFPLAQLHKVAGIGFRGVAPPFVVGYVDVGYGSEGVAVFTGINYPF
jgi:outer membrane protein assembly factor BamA